MHAIFIISSSKQYYYGNFITVCAFFVFTGNLGRGTIVYFAVLSSAEVELKYRKGQETQFSQRKIFSRNVFFVKVSPYAI